MTAPCVHDNAAFASATPVVSVLIPFLRDDPSALLEQLAAEAEGLNGAVEVIVMDDGTGDEALTQRLQGLINGLPLPIRLISLPINEGRARGRNRLTTNARAGTFLFLDSDMQPDSDAFLQDWATLARDSAPAVAFGGFSLDAAPRDPRFAVHRALSLQSECVPAAERSKQPEKYVYTSNLLVRRDVFEAERFDPGFTGWGWEDVEWAMRVSRRFPIVHVDNPATHMGLDTVDALARKFEQGAPNFARVVALHPQLATAYPSYKAARLIRKLPVRSLLRAGLKTIAKAPLWPVAMRAFALRLYRTALYAEAI
ncbi:glycosyltransferase family 2 protein [Brevundimonas sp. PAMC22021]|uniref:glycosyltransferase family 2 protein n=1 Tax=Brevundimonas sp. PAMC22021 TaxID=2861285 RepID=UPI001C632B60|nr:glycosyltransferase family A protein [Brevundimonas sp. PAMC22021]QYF88152.1 glycosyltransferase family 2 protein [Brevundimonas sp. PAMC22021]